MKLWLNTAFAAVMRRLNQRTKLGIEKHNGSIWLDPKTSMTTEFLRDRYEHAKVHLDLLKGGNADDDNIGAVLWFCQLAILAEEEFGVDWKEILTPKEEGNP